MSRAYYNEKDPFCVEWLRQLIVAGEIAPGDVDGRDIQDVKPNDLKGYSQCHFFAGVGVWSAALRAAGWSDRREVWTGSCPCEPFSAAGQGGGFDDERHLWPAFHHLIAKRRPATVFGEQVASKDGLAWLDLVQSDLEGARYAVGAVDLCAAGFGAPHIRQRLYWVAYAAGEFGKSGFRDQAAQGKGRLQSADRGAIRILADADGRDAGAKGLQRSGQHGQQPAHGRAGVVAHADGRQRYGVASGKERERDRPATGRIEGDGKPQRGCEVGGAGPVNGRWRDADWILCRDDKWRPVEAGTFPLADGSPARVGRLRAYGNAIVLGQATEFIAAAERARRDCSARPLIDVQRGRQGR